MRILRHIQCWLIGHDTRTHQRFSSVSRRVVCERCGGDWAMNDSMRILVPWSGDFEEFYTQMGYRVRPVRREK